MNNKNPNKIRSIFTSLFIDDCKNLHRFCEHWKLKGFCGKGDYRVWMNRNCKKSCGSCRNKDVRYIKELLKRENNIRIRSHRMASVPARNKLQIQVTYCNKNIE